VKILSSDELTYFGACLSAGAILTGFCGTFLSFRIQREATYYRQPVCDYKLGKGRDVYLGLSHFSSPFFLLILGTLLAAGFGFVCPLLAISGFDIAKSSVVAGMLAALVTILGYFACELVHYGVLNAKLLNDRQEWGRSSGIVVATIGLSVLAATVVIQAWGPVSKTAPIIDTPALQSTKEPGHVNVHQSCFNSSNHDIGKVIQADYGFFLKSSLRCGSIRPEAAVGKLCLPIIEGKNTL